MVLHSAISKDIFEQISIELLKKSHIFAEEVFRENTKTISEGIANEILNDINDGIPKELPTKFPNIFLWSLVEKLIGSKILQMKKWPNYSK